MTLETFKTTALIAMAIAVIVTSIIILIMALMLYPRVSASITNIESSTARADNILADVEVVSDNIADISGSLRAAAADVSESISRVADASEHIGETAANLRDRFQAVDLASTDLAERIVEARAEFAEAGTLMEQLRQLAGRP